MTKLIRQNFARTSPEATVSGIRWVQVVPSGTRLREPRTSIVLWSMGRRGTVSVQRLCGDKARKTAPCTDQLLGRPHCSEGPGMTATLQADCEFSFVWSAGPVSGVSQQT